MDADHANSSTVQHMITELDSRVQHRKPKHANRASFSRVQHMKQIEKGGRSIFKVPLSIKKLETDAFVPHIVSIGPYHWHKKHLMEMETCKSILLDHVLKRAGMQLTTLKEKMSELVAATRKHYDQPFKNIKYFVEMMLRDACFIIELFCIEAYGWENYGHTSDPYIRLNMKGFMPFVRRDLLMLENQLPLSVLQKMFTVLDWKKITPNESIHSLAINFFKQLIPGISRHVKNRPPPPPLPPCLHLLDIVHESLKPTPSANNKHWICTHGNCLISSPISLPCFSMTICVQDSDLERVSSDPPDIVMHSVTSLRSTGIGFKENKNCEKFTDIQFDHKNGMLLIPRLHINGSTKSIFLNLMVFEQGYSFCSRLYITSYTIFMDGLVDSAKDAQHLIEKNIIYHELGSEDNVATLFNSFRREIYFKCLPNVCYLYNVSQKLDEHYQQKWRSWIATLKHEYLKDPWKTISLIAAALLILLTITQTAYTVVGYHLPRP
ncbi:UPF0481 protein [Camellia lanceoleosa]|uniref:UPF0481 protein n=1 Tax=Camellia lanceoleosa TaxID=1840588 RepID=A0ACC0FBS8_9ERIC|nr:UPF0481 protein [Camellia lanceoleosa]